MSPRRLAAAALVAAMLPLAPRAQPADGAALHQLCLADAEACIAVLKDAVERYRGDDADWFCPPGDGDPRELRRLYLEWAEESPNELPKPRTEAVRSMLADAFPCSD